MPATFKSQARPEIAKSAGFAVALIAAAALVGWYANVPWLTSWSAGLPTMKPITALCLLALGFCVANAEFGSVTSRAVAFAVMVVAAVTLLQDFAGVNFRFESWPAPRGLEPTGSEIDWRMAPATATGLMCTALAVGLPGENRNRTLDIVLILAIAVIASFSLFNYIAGVEAADRGVYVRTLSLPATIAFLILAWTLYDRLRPNIRISRPTRISNLLLALGASIAVPLLALGAYGGLVFTKSEQQQSRNHLLDVARSLSAAIDRETINDQETAQALAASPSLKSGDLEAFHGQAQASLRHGAFLLVGRDGRQLVNTRVPFGESLPERTGSPDLVQEVFRTGKLKVSGISIQQVNKQLGFSILLPVHIDSEVRYVIIRSPGLESVGKLLNDHKLPEGWLANVSDASHRLIARSDAIDVPTGTTLTANPQISSETTPDIINTTDFHGTPSVQAHVRSDLTGWLTAVSVPQAVFEGPTRGLWRSLAALSLLALVIVVSMATWLSRTVATSIGETAKLAEWLAVDQMEARPVPVASPVVEANELAAALVASSEKRRQSAIELRVSLERQQLLLEVTGELIARHDPVDIVRIMFEKLRTGINADACFAYRFDPQSRRLELLYEYGTPAARLQDIQSIGLEQAICGAVAASGEPFNADADYIASEPIGKFIQSMGVRAFASFPLKDTNGRVLGTIGVGSTQFECFSQETIDFLQTAAHFVSQAWERLEADRLSHDQLSEITALYDNAPVGLASFDRDLRFERVNEALATINGIPAGDHIGRSVWDIVPNLRHDLEPKLLRVVETGLVVKSTISGETAQLPGVMRHWQENYYPLTGRDGAVIGVGAVVEEITERKQRELDLAVAAERVLVAQQTMRAMDYEYLPRSGIVNRSERSFMVLAGFGAHEVPSSAEAWRSLIHPDHVVQAWAAVGEGISKGNGFALEYRIRHKLGHYIWVSDRARILKGHGSAGDRVIGMVTDISEQKAREDHLFFMMHEVNHRSKNILAVVQAIARQTAATSNENMLDRLLQRIQALSANQDLLIRNDWQGIDMEALVHAQLAHLADSNSSRLKISGPAFRLSAPAAQAIGLALHELATNASKYGSLANETGHLEVQWFTDGGELRVHWTERDGPAVVPPHSKGFGTTVITSMAEMSLRGVVQLDYAPAGVTWRLTCPLDNALDVSRGGRRIVHTQLA